MRPCCRPLARAALCRHRRGAFGPVTRRLLRGQYPQRCRGEPAAAAAPLGTGTWPPGDAHGKEVLLDTHTVLPCPGSRRLPGAAAKPVEHRPAYSNSLQTRKSFPS